MDMKIFGVAGALLVLALVIGLVVGTSSVSATPPPEGSVFITGHDPDYHAQDPSCSGAGAQRLLEVAINFATNGSDKPLLVIYNPNPPDPEGHRDSIAGLETVTTNFVKMNASKFKNVKLTPAKYSAIFVPSDFGGQLTQVELDALNQRKEDIRNYLNQGGGLIALSESNGGAGLTPGGGHFGFVPATVTSTADGHKFGDKVTTFGEDVLGLIDADVTCNFSHNYFNDDAGMEVVDYLDENNDDDFDRDGDKIMSLAYRGSFGPTIIEEDDGKVSLCHFTGNTADPWELIRVPASAVASHIPGHEDVYPDEDGNCPS